MFERAPSAVDAVEWQSVECKERHITFHRTMLATQREHLRIIEAVDALQLRTQRSLSATSEFIDKHPARDL